MCPVDGDIEWAHECFAARYGHGCELESAVELLKVTEGYTFGVVAPHGAQGLEERFHLFCWEFDGTLDPVDKPT